jgi:hypothetical protein
MHIRGGGGENAHPRRGGEMHIRGGAEDAGVDPERKSPAPLHASAVPDLSIALIVVPVTAAC